MDRDKLIEAIRLAIARVLDFKTDKNVNEDTKKELSKLIDFANKFHRVEECGKIEEE